MMLSASRWGVLALLFVLLLWNLSGIGQPPPPPPSPAPVAPNASLVTANVVKYSIWNTQLLGFEQPTTLFSLVLEVLASEQISPQLLNLVREGDVIEAFSRESLDPELFGKKVMGTMRLVGDERGQRFWISGIEVLNPSEGGRLKGVKPISQEV